MLSALLLYGVRTFLPPEKSGKQQAVFLVEGKDKIILDVCGMCDVGCRLNALKLLKPYCAQNSQIYTDHYDLLLVDSCKIEIKIMI